MKKSFISLGLMLSAMFTLTNCAKELDAPVETPEQEGIPYELIASVDNPAVKTENEGLSTKWVANDALNVFYAEAGSTVYSKNREFKISAADLQSNRFTGTIDPSKPLAASNDWYVLYPYSSYIKTPANIADGYLTIGSSASGSQKQVGIDNMSHIAGKDYPIYGVVKGSLSQENLSVGMKHVSSVLKVVVTNNSGADLPISSISFTAPENIVGTYYIDFSKEPLTIKDSNAKHVSKVATLDVTDATIVAGDKAAFYLAIKPFQATAADLIIEVNGYKKTIKEATTTFASGKIKTLNFDYDKAYVADDFSGTYMITVKNSNSYLAMLALDGNSNGRLDDLLIEDYTSGIYQTPNEKLVWTIAKDGTEYTIKNVESFLNYKKSGALLTSTKETFIIKKGTVQGACHIISNSNNKSLKLNPGYGFGFYSNNNDIYLLPVKYLPSPVISVDVDSYAAQATDTKCEISFRRNELATGNVVVSVTEGNDWLSASVDQKLNKVICKFSANNGGVRNAKISISHENAKPQIVSISQAASGTVVHDGSTPELAYTFAEVKDMYTNKQHDSNIAVWVKGIIVGSVVNNKLVKANHSNSNVAIAASADAAEYIPVQLPNGNIRTNLNLVDNSTLVGRTLLIKGKIDTYFGLAGLKSPSEYQLL